MGKDQKKGLDLLQKAQKYYQSLEQFRKERDRNKRYTYGEQWSDIIEVDGRRITEEQYIKEQGSIPLKNNLIRRLVRNVIGIFNSQSELPACSVRDLRDAPACAVMDRLLHYNAQVNRLTALNTRSIEEFLISGMIIHKKSYCRRGNRTECWTDYIQPNNFFVDTLARDFRGWDCRMVGELHHVPFGEVAMQFADDEAECETLRNRFGCTDDDTLCTVTEIWCKEVRRHYTVHDTAAGRMSILTPEQYAAHRSAAVTAGSVTPGMRKKAIDEVWHYYFIAPDGHILAEGDSPYTHRSHPYVYKAYPMIDGEIHSFVSDVIDQQRYTNRLITLYDWIMRASSKGVLLVPEDCVPRGCSANDFVDAWSRYNGVIFYKPSVQGAVPQQVSNNSTNIGIKELLDVQLKFFEDISGVSHALQGKSSNVAISAKLYGQQTQNSTTNLLDILDTFNEFVRDSLDKDIKNIQQFYDAAKIRSITGTDTQVHGIAFDLEKGEFKGERDF